MGGGQLGIGVDDGIRTHDDWIHNPGLYLLSYAHHNHQVLVANYKFHSKPNWHAWQDSNLQPTA